MKNSTPIIKNLMRPLVRRIRELLRPLLRDFEKRRLKRKLLSDINAFDSGYEFSEFDINLYIDERVVSLPCLVTEQTDDPELVKITVCGKPIFWPVKLSSRGLSWLYHEIFDDFNSNPSSYNHPDMVYQSRTWIIDAGAAEGYFSIFALQMSPDSRIISIEPLTLMRSALTRTLSLYDNNNKAKVVCAALADKPGWAEMELDYENISDSKLSDIATEPGTGASNHMAEKVEIVTLDQLAVEHSLEAGGLIKMDIEGFEMAALSGASRLLKEYKPALAIAVYHELENAHKCADIIRAANPSYDISFRGCYGFFDPPRPYMLFAN